MPPPVNAAERRRAIATQAAELFDVAGYHTTSVEELAEAVGIRKPTLYHYFASKDEILFWIHEEFIDRLLEQARAREGDGREAADELFEVMADVLELMETHHGHVRVFFEHHRELAADRRATIRAKRDAYRALVEGIVARGVRNGEFRELDPRLVTLAVFGACNWAYQWYRADGPLPSRRIAELFFDLVCNGLARRD